MDLLQWLINFLKKANSGSGIKNENMSDQYLAEELHKPNIRTFRRRKLHSPFIDNIWHDGLADVQLIIKFNEEVSF